MDGARAGVLFAVPREARTVGAEWDRLAEASVSPPVFGSALIKDLPEPARRWLAHVIAPGTPLWRTAVVTMRGQIRLGAWRPFTARQVITVPEGYIWAATARMVGLPVTGFDRLSSGTGQMHWRLLGLVPVMTADGPDITRSAAGRLAAEIVLVPTAFRTVTWTSGAHGDSAIATCQAGGETEHAELRVGPDGRLLGLIVNRWGNPDGEPYGRYPFGMTTEAEATFAGVTLPAVFRAGWWWGTDRQESGEFFRARITGAAFR
jgi:hypothetical protein